VRHDHHRITRRGARRHLRTRRGSARTEDHPRDPSLNGKNRHSDHGPVAGFSKLDPGVLETAFFTNGSRFPLAEPASRPAPDLERRRRRRPQRNRSRLGRSEVAGMRSDQRLLVRRRIVLALHGGSRRSRPGSRTRPHRPRLHCRAARPDRHHQTEGGAARGRRRADVARSLFCRGQEASPGCSLPASSTPSR